MRSNRPRCKRWRARGPVSALEPTHPRVNVSAREFPSVLPRKVPPRPRPHWSGLYAALARSSASDIGEMRLAAERQIRDSVMYNVYEEPYGLDRPVIGVDAAPTQHDGSFSRRQRTNSTSR